jgi:hypothetical protein
MQRVPQLQITYDENSIPVSAKCSLCGEQMPQNKPRIMNPIDNVAWFAAQLEIHREQRHLEIATGKSSGAGGVPHGLKTPEIAKDGF